jgi:enediyne biosynthesis protein E3
VGLWTSLRFRLFRIDASEVMAERRGFHTGTPASQGHLEQIGRRFLEGYHCALSASDIDDLGKALMQTDRESLGFAFEGAAMGLGLIDFTGFSKRRRWEAFLDGPGRAHQYILHIGLGWVFARIPWIRNRPERFLDGFDPLLQWLVLDGFGFHEGYFHWRRWLPPSTKPPICVGYGARAFDQGLGRSLWFVGGADVVRISSIIQGFEPKRRADLWSGVGLACTYAGKPTTEELEFLMVAAGPHSPDFGQGVAFAAEARELAGNQTDYTDHACSVVWGFDAHSTARLTNAARDNVASDSAEVPSFELWRTNIRELMRQRFTPCKYVETH